VSTRQLMSSSIEQQLEEVKAAIGKVEEKILKVEKEIEKVEKEIEEAGRNAVQAVDDKLFYLWRDRENKLRDEKSKLLDREDKLLDRQGELEKQRGQLRGQDQQLAQQFEKLSTRFAAIEKQTLHTTDESIDATNSSNGYEFLGNSVWEPFTVANQPASWESILDGRSEESQRICNELTNCLPELTHDGENKGIWTEGELQRWSKNHLCTRDWSSRSLHDTHNQSSTAIVGRHCQPDLILADQSIGLTESGTYCLVELKEASSTLPPTAVGQGLFAAQAALRKTQLRSFIFVLVTTLRKSRLIKCELDRSSNMRHLQRVKIVQYANMETVQDSLHCWVSLMLSSDQVLGAPLKHICTYPVLRVLGSGRTSTVYEVRSRAPAAEGTMFAKLFASAQSRDEEWTALQLLDAEEVLPFRDLGKADDASSLKYAIIGRPVFREVTLDTLEHKDWAHLVDSLQRLHEAGYVHRDVRPANFLLRDDTASSDQSSIRLIDYGYAVKAGTTIPFAGTLTYASCALQTQLESGQEMTTPAAADDLESLVKCRCRSLLNPQWRKAEQRAKALAGALNLEDLQQHACWAKAVWSDIMESFSNIVRIQELLNAARACDYVGLKTFM